MTRNMIFGEKKETYAISVNDCKEPMCQRIRYDGRDTEEFVAIDRPGPVCIYFEKPLSDALNLFVTEIRRLH